MKESIKVCQGQYKVNHTIIQLKTELERNNLYSFYTLTLTLTPQDTDFVSCDVLVIQEVIIVWDHAGRWTVIQDKIFPRCRPIYLEVKACS